MTVSRCEISCARTNAADPKSNAADKRPASFGVAIKRTFALIGVIEASSRAELTTRALPCQDGEEPRSRVSVRAGSPRSTRAAVLSQNAKEHRRCSAEFAQ